ncbi:MAG TPA: hypothetical protein VGO61_11130 [Steroidobacteraceae bacterium]|jgi:hypothetical protein|nr:hypothetical protein [Steroidobacteraceae bacterium]
MRFEKTQRGNPHQLVVQQHVFPLVSIERFCSPRRRVEVCQLGKNKTMTLKPEDQLFCAQRAWNNVVETGRFKRIEDAFQPLASRLADGTLSTIDARHAQTINEFFALCYYRAESRAHPAPDQRLDILGTRERYSRDKMEILEKNGYACVRPDGTLPGRHFAAIRAHFQIIAMQRALAGVRWRLIRSAGAEFIVPDPFPDVAVMPIAPDVCLCGGEGPDGDADADGVTALNTLLAGASRKYYFARQLQRCPRQSTY